jgi:hypothetical protein
MNVQKISQFILIITCFFGIFGFGSSAFAYIDNQVQGQFSGGNICIPSSSMAGYATGNWEIFVGYVLGGYTSGGYNGTGIYGNEIFHSGNDNHPMACEDSFYFAWDGTGTRYITYLTDANNNRYYAFFENGTAVPPVPPVPHISSFTYATTTATANITGYWEATTTPYITQRLSFWQFSDTLGKERYQQVIATTTGAFNFSFTFNDPYAWSSGESSTTPIFSSFTLNASLDQYDETNNVFPYGGEIIDNLDATSTTISASVYNASDFISTPRDLALYPEYECGITSMMGCIKNAAIWLFYPTQDALDSWTSLKTTLETKAPIGYFYSVKNAVGGLSATSTPSFSLTIPAHLKQYIFDPFDIGIAGILWFFFIFHFYKRLKTIQI